MPALRRLLLEACEEPTLTLTLQEPFYRLDTQGGEQLAFQVGVTDEEALPCQLTRVSWQHSPRFREPAKRTAPPLRRRVRQP